MLSPEFNTVYDEAFQSVTGRLSTTVDYQRRYELYANRTVEALLGHWTSPDTAPDVAITDEFTTRRAHLFQLKHPLTIEFTEEDAESIARIRYFGSQTIDAAILAIDLNERHRGEKVGLGYSQWHRAHPDNTIFPDLLASTPDAPAPVRLLNWPYGDYINCLGISIAAAAQSERDPDIDYVFMNRIRHAQYETNVNFAQISRRINNFNPYAVYLEEIIHAASSMYQNEPPGSYRCAYGDDTPHFITNADPDTAFHHAVIRKKKGSEDIYTNGWRQYDPYGLVDSELSNYTLSNEAASRFPAMSDGNCNEVLLYDSDVVDFSFHNTATAVDVAIKLQDRLRSALADYKSSNFLRNLKHELFLQKNAVFGAMFGHDNTEQLTAQRLIDSRSTCGKEDNDIDFQYQWLLLLCTTAESAASTSGNDEIRRILKYPAKPGHDQAIEQKLHHLESFLAAFIKTDSELRNSLTKIIISMPLAYCLNILEESVKTNSLAGGTADQTMEIGDPAFMIGSMYLNHYARWRKGGRVNVAKEIARLTPSQLIWQAAVADDQDAARDPRVHAVGDLVKGLKLDQQHPLVRITAHPRRR